MNNSNVDDECLNEEWPFQDKEGHIQKQECLIKINRISNKFNKLNQQVQIQMENIEYRDQYSQSFNPNKNIQQIIWNVMIVIALFQLLLIIPQDQSFGISVRFGFQSDIIITIMFTIDIIINFFQAYEDLETGQMVFENFKITIQQFKNGFLLDLISTVPVDQIFAAIDFNTNIFKSVKIVKFLKVLKLIRLIKVFTYSSFDKTNYLQKEIGKEFQIQIKRTSGIFELLNINSQILIAAHQYTIIFWIIKHEQIENNDLKWLSDQQNIEEMSIFNIQVYLLSQSVKTAVGLSVNNPTNIVEIIITTIWMFVGLSMFGQGIGNISTYFQNAIQDEVDQMNSIQFFEKICLNNDINKKLLKKILSEVECYYDYDDEEKFNLQSRKLSYLTLKELNCALQSKFINSFELLNKFDQPIIRLIQNNLRSYDSRLPIKKSEVINQISCMTYGKMTLYNNKMDLINEYSKNEIFGLGQFITYMIKKQNIKLDELIQKYNLDINTTQINKDINQESLINENEEIENNIKDKLESKSKSNLYSKELDTSIDEYQICKFNVIQSDDAIFFNIKFKTLVDILQSDIKSFIKIWEQNKKQYELITFNDQLKSKIECKLFNKSPSPAIMINNNNIYEVNFAAQKFQNMNRLNEQNFVDIFKHENNDDISNIDDLKVGNILKQNIENQELQLKIDKIEETSITRSTQNIEKDSITQQKLKKSMLKVKIIWFKLNNDENNIKESSFDLNYLKIPNQNQINGINENVNHKYESKSVINQIHSFNENNEFNYKSQENHETNLYEKNFHTNQDSKNNYEYDIEIYSNKHTSINTNQYNNKVNNDTQIKNNEQILKENQTNDKISISETIINSLDQNENYQIDKNESNFSKLNNYFTLNLTEGTESDIKNNSNLINQIDLDEFQSNEDETSKNDYNI